MKIYFCSSRREEAHSKILFNARPHPNPLPGEREQPLDILFLLEFFSLPTTLGLPNGGKRFSLSLGRGPG